MIFTVCLYLFLNILLAYIDSRIFAKHKTIMHGINAIEYIAMIAVPWFMFNNAWLIVTLLMQRLIVFNIALSIFRKLKWSYISTERKAITDKIAFFFFGYRGAFMYSCYALLLVFFIFKTFKIFLISS